MASPTRHPRAPFTTPPHGAQNPARSHPAVASLAQKLGVSPQRLAVAWLLSKGPQVIVIVGAARSASIEDSALAAELVLDAEAIAEIDEATA